MPTSARRPCKYPGCPNLEDEGGYCAGHATAIGWQYDRARGSASQRGYDNTWRKLRAMKLAADPICCDPFHRHLGQWVIATEVDHILPKAQGGTNSWENLQSLCKPCHSYKTETQDMRHIRGQNVL